MIDTDRLGKRALGGRLLQSRPFRHSNSLLALTAICLTVAGCASGSELTLASEQTDTGCKALLARPVTVEALELSTADGRKVPFEIIHPDKPGAYPLIVFSHGAFAAPDRYHALLKPLASAGYVIVAPLHIDSEEWKHVTAPSREDTWTTRGADMVLGLSVPVPLELRLARSGITIDASKIVAMGHSYGALLAQIAGGAEPASISPLVRDPKVRAVVAFSPPGPMPGLIENDGWKAMSLPTLLITGTSDASPGFVDNWEVHKASYAAAPVGKRWLWVGEGVDHYFGGMIGREKPADSQSRKLLYRATMATVAFLQSALQSQTTCSPQDDFDGETLIKD